MCVSQRGCVPANCLHVSVCILTHPQSDWNPAVVVNQLCTCCPPHKQTINCSWVKCTIHPNLLIASIVFVHKQQHWKHQLYLDRTMHRLPCYVLMYLSNMLCHFLLPAVVLWGPTPHIRQTICPTKHSRLSPFSHRRVFSDYSVVE